MSVSFSQKMKAFSSTLVPLSESVTAVKPEQVLKAANGITVTLLGIVTDVNFATGEGVDETESIAIGEGAGIDISAITDVKLTRAIMKMLDTKGIKYQRVCEPSRTSTNSEGVSISGKGVRTLLMSIPLESMHTPSELVCLDDIRSLSDILLEVAYTNKEAL